LHFLQALFHLLRLRILLTYLCCICERKTARKNKSRRIIMQNVMQNTVSVVAALVASGLAFALALV